MSVYNVYCLIRMLIVTVQEPFPCGPSDYSTGGDLKCRRKAISFKGIGITYLQLLGSCLLITYYLRSVDTRLLPEHHINEFIIVGNLLDCIAESDCYLY